ncbi:hypothetical protein [Rubrivivax albus]|nr:hypothetical protein [Rubrivivax albus]
MRMRDQAVPSGAWQDPALRAALDQLAALSHENAVLGRHLANVQARAAQQAADHARAIESMRRQFVRLRTAALRRAIEAQVLRDALRHLPVAITTGPTRPVATTQIPRGPRHDLP